jgi:hypothetical protein
MRHVQQQGVGCVVAQYGTGTTGAGMLLVGVGDVAWGPCISCFVGAGFCVLKGDGVQHMLLPL